MVIDIGRKARSLLTTICLIAILLCFSLLPAGASLESQLDDVNKELEDTRERITQSEEEESGLSKEISSIDTKIAGFEKELRKLDDELDGLASRRKRIEADLKLLQLKLDQNQQELKETQIKLAKQKSVANDRAENIYQDGELQYLEILLKAESLKDLLGRAYLLRCILDQDLRIVDEIRTLKGEIELKKQAISKTKEETEGKRAELLRSEARLKQISLAQEKKKNQSEAQAGKKRDLLEDVKQNKADYLQAEAELERTSSSIATLIRASRNVNRPVSAAGFVWPVNGELSSNFGMRRHPIFGGNRMHTGIDIAASYGQQVTAARGGVVIASGSMGGYGRTVIIDHGDGLSSLYGHLSAAPVDEGEYVVRGSAIGQVGCSGYCTGPHLHFEIRVNGDPENPLQWL